MIQLKNEHFFMRYSVYALAALCFLCYASCSRENIKVKEVIAIAKGNAEEIEKVLSHYPAHSQKYKAALFLVENMFHSYTESCAFNEYRDSIWTIANPSVSEMNDVWFFESQKHEYENDHISFDAEVITSDYLINSIDVAYNTWKESNWYNQVSFKVFCHYILPYRVLDEPLSDWRNQLYEKYHFLIENETDVRKAFAKVYTYLYKQFGSNSLKCSYTPDILMADKQMTGICSHKCMYIIAVMRSLGIPASYDMIKFWANYSTSGHSWVSFIPSWGKTETMLPYDSIPHKNNIIDGSLMASSYRTIKLNVDTIKKVSKIYRYAYEICPENSTNQFSHQSESNDSFDWRFIKDVSSCYSQTQEKVSFRVKSEDCPIYLCTFASVFDWQVVTKSRIKHNRCRFDYIGPDIVYLPVSYDAQGNIVPMSNPFLLSKGGELHFFNPDITSPEKLVLRRKYVLLGHWVQRWSKMIGARFEASDNEDFTPSEILHEVKELPIGVENIELHVSKPYRYVRMKMRPDARPDIAELSYYSENYNTPLKGTLVYHGTSESSILKATDGDYLTHGGGSEDGYWWGYDMGNSPQVISRITYCMRTDLNMIVPGDEYELLYYDKGWKSLGRKRATCDSLVYEGPANALFWLRNHSSGREERIFSYDDDKQKWW